MKALPRWSIGIIFILTTLLITLSVSNFSKKAHMFTRGSLQLAEGLEDLAKGIRTVFIVIYDEDSPMPMPYAAIKNKIQKDPSGQFMKFVLTKDNMQVMNPQQQSTPKKMRIKARLDRNGLGGKDEPGDLTGTIEHVAEGSENIIIKINHIVKAPLSSL